MKNEDNENHLQKIHIHIILSFLIINNIFHRRLNNIYIILHINNLYQNVH